MPNRLGRITVDVRAGHAMIILLGTGFQEISRPDFSARQLVYAGDDMLYLMSGSSGSQASTVTVEAWDAEPKQADDAEWEERGEARFRLQQGGIYVSRMLEGPIGPTLEVGRPGDYQVRVQARGREEVQRLQRQPGMDPDDIPDGIEQFLVQLWPADLN